MLLVFQFPLADTRPFSSAIDDRLPVPHWPRPNTDINPEFIHHVGKTVERRRGADHAWTDEITFCLARRAIRFENLAMQRVGPSSAHFRPAMAFRRLFCDGRTVVRAELGLKHNADRERLHTALTAEDVLQIADDACGLPTWVPHGARDAREWKPLIGQGKELARLYARASRRRQSGLDHPSDPGVYAGRPLLLIELPGRTSIDLPWSFTAVPPAATQGAILHFGRLKSKYGVVSAWVLQRGTAAGPQLRSLRLCLLRLHAEHECLDSVVSQIQARRIPENVRGEEENPYAEELNDYLNAATRLLNRSEWSKGIQQSAILSAYDAAELVTPAANRSLLASRFEGARRQVWRKVEDYQVRRAATRIVNVTNVERGATHVEKNITVTGGQGVIINVAEYMSNVTNTVTSNLGESTASAEVQQLVKTLTEQIAQISTKVDPKTTQAMGADVETLSREMTREQPRRSQFEVSLEGLKEAAVAVGELGVPILATLKKLWPLLLPVIG